MIYKMTLKDSSDTMTFNLLETPIVDKDIEGAVDNVTLDGNQYTDYLYLKKQYIQKWAIMCPDEYDELRGFYTRQFEEGEVPSYRVYYGANVTKDYIYNGDYFQFNAKGLETGMYLSQLTGNAEQTTYSGKNLFNNRTLVFKNDGVTLTITSDNSMTMTNTGTASWIGAQFDVSGLSANTDYTLSFNQTNTNSTMNNWLVVQINGSNVVNASYASGSGKTFNTGSGTAVRIWFYVQTAGGTVANNTATITNIQLEKGTAKTDFEKYVGGTPAPNPEFPMPISTVTGEQNIKVVGKNLFDGSTRTLGAPSNTAYPNTTKRLFDLSTFVSGMTRNNYYSSSGITTTKNADGSFTITTNQSYYGAGFPFRLKAGTYTYSMTITGASTLLAVTTYADDGTYISAQHAPSSTGHITFTLADDTNILLGIMPESATTVTASNIQLELGSQASDYEPYQSQSYEVNLGKNLVPFTNQDFTLKNVRYYAQDGSLYIDGTSTGETSSADAQFKSNFAFTLSAGTYTATHKTGLSGITAYIKKQSDNSNLATLGANVASSGFTLTEPTAVYLGFYVYQASNSNVNAEIQLEKGSTATSYAPYFTPIELAKIGTYQDRIYKDDGKWYVEKQVGKVDLGTLTWINEDSTQSGQFRSNVNSIASGEPLLFGGVICSNLIWQEGNVAYNALQNGHIALTNSQEVLLLRARDASFAGLTADAFKSLVNGWECYYALATPTTTEITDETLLSELNFIASLYGGVNNISIVGTGAQGEMEVLIRDVLDVERDVVPETPVRLTLTDGGVINACGCRRDVELTMRETTE